MREDDSSHGSEDDGRPRNMSFSWSNDLISSASDNNSNGGIEPYCEVLSATANGASDLSPRLKNRKTSPKAVIAHNRSSEEKQSFVSTRKPGIKTTQTLQRKPSQSSATPEESKKAILEIYERLKSDKEKTKQSIFEAEYRRAFNQKVKYSRISLSRFTPTGEKVKLECMQGKSGPDHRSHTILVKSSLTILPTSDEAKLKEDAEQLEIQTKAGDLHLMPFHFKMLQEEFSSILDELPFHHQYDPDVQEYISEILDTPPKNIRAKLEAPSRFKTTPTSTDPKVEATPDIKDSDENNMDYVSTMSSFRDFCSQCKTFDCHFHITEYPDAATQASVAIQYDKRALQQQSRSIRQSGRQQTNNAGHNGDSSNFLAQAYCHYTRSFRVEARKSFRVEGSDGSTFNLHVQDNKCPFCKFPCHNSEKLWKHMKRYHTDTFYFNEANNTITATMRTEASETMKPVREYFHPNSFIPIQNGHYDRDLDDESVYSWYHDYRNDLLQELVDVSEKEKRIESIWNRFLGCSPIVVPDKAMPEKVLHFIRKHFENLMELEWEFYQLLITFWERRLLSVIHVENFMHLYHCERVDKSGNRNKIPLTPRERVICSRLHLIFQSLDGAMSRFLKAIRRTDIRSHDLVSTPVVESSLKWPTLSRSRKISEVIRMRSQDISRPFFFPCFHAGSCNEANNCSCIENNCLCTKHCMWGEYGVNFFNGCNCSGDCSNAKQCFCRDMNRECDPDVCMCNCCGASKGECDRKCTNKVVSLAQRVPLLIGTSNVGGAGLGLFTKNPLKKGDYIDEYIGEFIKRENETNRSQEYYFDHSDDYVVDATHQGNKTRFLNHSLTPNIEAKNRFVNGEKRVAFFARRDIPAQAELYYSYGKSYNKVWRSKNLPQLCVDSDDDGYEDQDSDA